MSDFFITELSAGSFCFSSHTITNGNGNPSVFEDIFEFHNSFSLALFEVDSWIFVVWDEVEVGKPSFKKFYELVSELWLVGHIFDHDVFVEDAIVGSFYIFIDGGHEFIERKSFTDRHNLISKLLIWSVEGNREFDIHFVFDEFFDPWNDSAGGNCDMSSS